MLSTVKSELRKLLSVRSTYIVSIIFLAFVGFFSLYVEGYWGQSGSAAGNLEATAFKEVIGGGVGLVALAISIIAILQVGHEYRYNIIMHTLTANARRTQVFLAKALVLSLFAIGLGLSAAVLSIVAYKLGVSLRGAELPAQELDLAAQTFRVAVYSAVYGMFGFLLAMLTRSIILAIVVLLLLPSTIEPLLGLLLKDNAKYLPVSSFDHIMGVAIGQTEMMPNTAILLSLLYIGVLSLITWVVFVRRDAN